ncbi:bardet-Biedl syndrome 1 family protein [Achlya hypogyna]|uniref:Bardet-Biedl syndrome 1 family protein n=1 Tax=Achlya hypogyna TaxID=1202772 RepID=A0A1V9ZTA5_ACHHY|nr:bardet-Biedl syndrome 1 family protein [Achlya hypogyna]
MSGLERREPTPEKVEAAPKPEKSTNRLLPSALTHAIGPWLHAYHNTVAGIKAFTQCIKLADVYGDGDYKLIVADADRRLKMYKGSTLLSEQAILGVPVALCVFYSDSVRPRTPSIAVASGPSIYIYRNMRPYYKFTLPPLDVVSDEVKLWAQLAKCEVDIIGAVHQLNTLRSQGAQLSQRSRGFLAIDDMEQQAEFVSRYMDDPLVEQTTITCMATLNKSMDEKDAVGCLVIGTEAGQVYVLDQQGANITTKAYLPSTPVDIVVNGLFDVEYRLIVSCRNGSVYTVKNGELLKSVIELESPACALLQMDKSIIVACMDRKITSFHLKGKKNWSMTMAQDIVAMEALNLRRTKNSKGILIALRKGEVLLYNEKIKITSFHLDSLLTAMVFGQYGREEASLVLVHKSGALTLKILQRNADLEGTSTASGPPPEQDIPLNVPKKTKLYVEQTQRERDHAVEMHRHFQRDLCKLRLTTVRSYVKVIRDGQGPVSYATGASIRLNAKVQGIGPLFKVQLQLQNSGAKFAADVPIVLHYDHGLYRIRQSLLQIPLLLPGVQYAYTIDVENISDTGAADSIYIFVCGKDSCVPLVSAVVNMPLSDIVVRG